METLLKDIHQSASKSIRGGTLCLVNPPNEKIVLRDMYSSTISKGVYNWPNVDLLCLSGILKESFDVRLIDANTLGYTCDETVKLVSALKPVGIVFSFGNSVKEDDYHFVQKLRECLPDIKICGTGGLLYHSPEKELLNHPEFDACLLNFTTKDILKFFLDDYEDLNNIVYRVDNKIVVRPKKYYDHQFSFPVPLHEQLPLKKYRVSHGFQTPLTSVLTAFGCPAKCGFCVSGRIDYRYRSAENVIEELNAVKALNVKEIFFRDNVFGAVKKESTRLMEQMISNDYRFSWVADTRANLITPESAPLMRKSGCHALHMGVESASNETLKKYHKGIGIEKMKAPFKLCHEYGIQSLGYFIIGLPGETLDDIKRTIDLALELDCDFASFNMAMPIVGTDLRDEALKSGLIKEETSGKYDGSLQPLIESEHLNKKQILMMRKEAFRRFYLRPSYIAKRISKVRTLFQAHMLFQEAYNLIRRQADSNNLN